MLYKLSQNKQDYTKVKRVTLADIGWKELDLQRLMSSHIQDFIYSNDLLTISMSVRGRRNRTFSRLTGMGIYIFWN